MAALEGSKDSKALSSWRTVDMPLRSANGLSQMRLDLFDADVHRALRLRAAACNRLISAMLNKVVLLPLADDEDDLRDADQRQAEENNVFERLISSRSDSGQV
jgi:hypothetical protein